METILMGIGAIGLYIVLFTVLFGPFILLGYALCVGTGITKWED